MRSYGHLVDISALVLGIFCLTTSLFIFVVAFPTTPTVAPLPTAWTTAARTILLVASTARWTIATTEWLGVRLLSFPIEGIRNGCNIYTNMDFSV
jgi:hypothetical protein